MTCVESHFFPFQNNKPKYAHFLHSSILMDIFVSQDGGKILIRVSGSRNVFLDKSFQGFVLSWKICLFVSLSISSNRLPPLPLCATSSVCKCSYIYGGPPKTRGPREELKESREGEEDE